MKLILPLFLLLISPCLMAQDDPAPDTITFNTLLQPGEFFNFSNNSIHFKEVISDSRCPKEVTCVWEGEARVLVALYENGDFLKEKIITISNGNIPLDFTVKDIDYSIGRMNLLPYPTTKQVDPEYSLEISIIEKS